MTKAQERPVIIRHTSGEYAGSESELASAEIAKDMYPGAKIVRFADTGEPYKAPPKPKAEDAPVKADAPKAEPAKRDRAESLD